MTDQNQFKKIIICGAGLAGTLCAAALTEILPDDVELTLLDIEGAAQSDIFYGTVTSPSIYDFFLEIGITEPELFPYSNTTFSLGTDYKDWSAKKRSWVQAFHQPLPIMQGVDFHHYLTRAARHTSGPADIAPYIMSVHAAKRGVFAHPPEGQKAPLSTMEYGYQFLPEAWRALFARKVQASGTTCIQAEIESVNRDGETISAITLTDGTTHSADLFIDCSGPDSKIANIANQTRHGERILKAVESFKHQDRLGPVCRSLTGAAYGWHAETALQGGQHCLTVFDPASEPEALAAHEATSLPPVEAIIGYLDAPWQGNCLSLGHSAAILEPLTPAPMTLLQRDIERLIELIPISQDMTVERREYNRRFLEDYRHASDFHRGFFENDEAFETPYWKAAAHEPVSQKLNNKTTQFISRGVTAQYDLEPFSKQDWVQQHYGMGRHPERYDRLADRAEEAQLMNTLQQMRGANDAMAQKLPPHHIYMTSLLKYLRKQHG